MDTAQPSPAGTRRRIRALMARAWAPEAIERASGIPAAQIRAGLADEHRISPSLAASVAAAYDGLWDAPPPRATEQDREASDAAAARARRARWPPPLAWDDDELDNPAAGPAPGWSPTGRTTIPSADLAEDVAFVREAGGYRHAPVKTVAMRLGVKPARIEKALERTRRQAEPEREAG